MTAMSYCFGHACYYDGDLSQWLYVDTKEPIGEIRRCPQCDQYPTPEGYDPCIGFVPGATSICCGHGITEPIKVIGGRTNDY